MEAQVVSVPAPAPAPFGLPVLARPVPLSQATLDLVRRGIENLWSRIVAADLRADERPLLLIVRDDDSTVSELEIRDFLSGQMAKWWLPDAIEFVEELPHTATGKLSKKDLRDQYRDYRFANAEAMVGRD